MGKKIRKMTIEDHFEIAELLSGLMNNRLITKVMCSYNQNTKIVKHLRKLKEIPGGIRCDLEEEIFRDVPEIVQLLDKEFGKHGVLKIYYGTPEKKEEIKIFLI